MIIIKKNSSVYFIYLHFTRKEKKWIKKENGIYEKLKKLFPSNSEIDQYFQEIFLL